jgi:DNA-binding GntR family transcriptional regulator
VDLTVARTTIQSQVVTKLREAIFAGVFAPGEKLSEPSLCRSLGVSRTSIREALRSLAADKLVTIIPNRGPSVTEISWEEAEAIYQVRTLLEGEAMALLARRVQPADLQEIAAALADFEAAARRGDAVGRITSTARFYDVILGRCGNPILAEVLQGLLARINLLRAHSMSGEGRSRGSFREMRAMLAALEAGDPEAARAAAVDHVIAARAAAYRVFCERQSFGR